MKILVVGGGGREHALVWQLAKHGHELVCVPGNPGIRGLACCVASADVVELAEREAVELVVVGPEAPLVDGLADRLRERGIAVFGPGADGAQLEGSKSFSKAFFARHGIRTADFSACSTMAEAEAAIERLGDAVVVKADGLAAGKGVVVCDSAAAARAAARDMLEGGAFGPAGARIVIEKRLVGFELSLMALTDGERFALLAPAEDHKAIGEGDVGPNTGGMGTVSPTPWASQALIDRACVEIFTPTLRGLRAEGIDYRGVLYAGLMIDGDGTPWLLEYNCRFGDPETQPVMARLTSDLGRWLHGAACGQLPAEPLAWDERAAVCVILASRGYPASAETGVVISGIEAAEREGAVVFHAGTATTPQGLMTAGGRVLGVTALGDDTQAARERAYAAVAAIHFDGMQLRRDIGARDKTR